MRSYRMATSAYLALLLLVGILQPIVHCLAQGPSMEVIDGDLHFTTQRLLVNNTDLLERIAAVESSMTKTVNDFMTITATQATLEANVSRLHANERAQQAALNQTADNVNEQYNRLKNDTNQRLAALKSDTEQRLAALQSDTHQRLAALNATLQAELAELKHLVTQPAPAPPISQIENVIIALGDGSIEVFDGSHWAGWDLQSYTPPSIPGITAWRNRLLVVGGWIRSTSTVLATVVSIGTDGSVLRHHDLPTVLNDPFAVTFRGEVYVIGGFQAQDTGANRLQTVYIYNGTHWRSGPPLRRTGRSAIECVIFKGLLHCLGGWSRVNGLWTSHDFVEIYNGTSWSDGPSMPIKNSMFGCAVHGNKIWTFGGRIEHTGSYVNHDSIYSFDGVTWTLSSTKLAIPRAVDFAVVLQDQIMLVGGTDGAQDRENLLNTVEAFNTTSSSLSPQPSTHFAGYLRGGGIVRQIKPLM
eukprot:TRINITY_DN11979_c1_g9_i1.p1 TRINITY_DN11979_c1_g9~~TRINITY_DN11979_c1_g9_i1.p1  ORF type:complete len:470 (+),score=66.14 TRINITY_DN11979_c1_g9_i1:126-1535(+)